MERNSRSRSRNCRLLRDTPACTGLSLSICSPLRTHSPANPTHMPHCSMTRHSDRHLSLWVSSRENSRSRTYPRDIPRCSTLAGRGCLPACEGSSPLRTSFRRSLLYPADKRGSNTAIDTFRPLTCLKSIRYCKSPGYVLRSPLHPRHRKVYYKLLCMFHLRGLTPSLCENYSLPSSTRSPQHPTHIPLYREPRRKPYCLKESCFGVQKRSVDSNH
jgi:hypothetical protein